MNSVKIRESHQEAYRNFFDEFEIVASANYSMPWSNELIDHASKFPLVRSKLPLKCYVGIRRAAVEGAKFLWVESYHGPKHGYKRSPWTEWSSSVRETERMLAEKMRDSDIEGGIEVCALCEIPRGRSIGFTETVNAALAYGMHALFAKDLSGWLGKSDEICDEKRRGLIDLAWELSLKPRAGNTMAQGIRNSFSSFGGPVAYFGEEMDETVGDVSKIRLWEKRLTDVSDSGGKLPIDVWIIYSGTPGDTQSIEEIRQSDAIEKERLGNFLDQLSEENGNFEQRYSDVEGLGYSAFRNVKKHLNYRGMELLESMGKFGWADDSLISRFIGNLNNSRALLSMISEQGAFAQTLIDEIRSHSNAEIGIAPLYSGKYGGSYIVVAGKGMAREAVEGAVIAKSSQFPGMEIIYSTHEDGHASESAEILKNQRGGLRSKGKNILLVDDFGNRRQCGYLEAISRQNGEILFDSISKKIYYNGKRLTSKEVPSQNAASDLFEMLIERMGKEVPNKSLPASSYSQNKNEMVSKIITPLAKFARTHANGELNVSCSGSLTEFRIMLERSDIRLGLIKHE